jgi:hypothetical protein
VTAREIVELHHLLEGPEDVLVMVNSPGATLRIREDQAPKLRETRLYPRLAVVDLANVERPEPVTREILAHLEPAAGEGR